MHRFALLLASLFLFGCGGGGGDLSSNYVGTFKAVQPTTGATTIITITQDDGTHYVGTFDNSATSGLWGQDSSLNKGSDTNHIIINFVTVTRNINGNDTISSNHVIAERQ